MTDLAPPDTPAAAAAPPGDRMMELSPEQTAAMREHWTSLGLDPEKFDRAAAGAPEPTDEATAPTLQAAPELDDDQVRELVEGLRAQGVPEADIQAALDADGYALAPEDQRTEEQREYDAVWGGAKPDAYRIDYVGRLPGGADVSAIAAFDGEARAWLSEIGFPAVTGAAVVETALDARNRLAQMSEPARQLWAMEQKALFEQVAGGPEQAAERMTLASKALARGGAAFTATLRECGALHDATLVALLALQEERRAVRP